MTVILQRIDQAGQLFPQGVPSELSTSYQALADRSGGPVLCSTLRYRARNDCPKNMKASTKPAVFQALDNLWNSLGTRGSVLEDWKDER